MGAKNFDICHFTQTSTMYILFWQVIEKFQEVINQVTKLNFDTEFSLNLVSIKLISILLYDMLLNV